MRQKRLFLIGMLVLATYAGIAQETPIEDQEVSPSTTVEQRSDTSDSEISPTESSDASPDTTQRQYFYNILFLLVSVILCFFGFQLRKIIGMLIAILIASLFLRFLLMPLWSLVLSDFLLFVVIVAITILLPILCYFDTTRTSEKKTTFFERIGDLSIILASMIAVPRILCTLFFSAEGSFLSVIIPGLILLILSKYYPKIINILITTIAGGWYIVFNTDNLLETIAPGVANITVTILCWSLFCFSGIVVQYKYSRNSISQNQVILKQKLFSRKTLYKLLHNLYPRAILIVLLLCGTCLLLYLGRSNVEPIKPVFEGSSKELQSTRIVATLDVPVEEGVNTIWCASFLAGWKTLEEDLAKEPLVLNQESELTTSLNKSPDLRPYIPQESLFATAGWKHKGIMDTIRKGLAEKFPGKKPPVYDDAIPESLIVYSYLEANVPFRKSYLQNDEPLIFNDSKGNETPLRSFGLRKKDDHKFFSLREQPKLLFMVYGENHSLDEFAVDLDRTSMPNQIILACIPRKDTFQEMFQHVEKYMGKTITAYDGTHPLDDGELGPPDILLVPDIAFYIKHQFEELRGHTFKNDALRKDILDIVEQDIYFRLDRSGAVLRSEFNMRMRCGPSKYIFDRPFLIYMKQRGAEMPYFAMWVDNTELLCKWGE